MLLSCLNGFALMLAQQADASTPAAGSARIESIWDFMIKGGPVMIPIAACSLVALAVIIERLLVLRRRKIIPEGFLPKLKETIAQPGGRTRAIEYCRTIDTPIAEIFAVGIKRLGEPLDVLERHVEQAGARAILSLRRRLRVLSMVASLSPLLGLLGTIFGMIEAFQTVANSAEALGRTELLASGIYAAMITTAAGLCVAIPVIVCYHWIAAKIDRLVEEVDQMVVEFVEEYALTSREKATAGALRLDSVAGSGNGHGAEIGVLTNERAAGATLP
ncbi:MAG TPA: MotA/TolQ/ExbB proton channel family protein [Phycisphaerae bacterium]|nr:MotA/TolQ/ExbB proton channel family protein [Phycisphaerae bacterium]